MNLQYELVGKIKCIKNGTAFFIDTKRALTARHAIEAHLLEKATITLEHYKGNKFEEIECRLIVEDKTLDIALIEVDKPISLGSFLSLNSYLPLEETNWSTIGFPVGDMEMGLSLR